MNERLCARATEFGPESLPYAHIAPGTSTSRPEWDMQFTVQNICATPPRTFVLSSGVGSELAFDCGGSAQCGSLNGP
jgi:hypothetical protein